MAALLERMASSDAAAADSASAPSRPAPAPFPGGGGGGGLPIRSRPRRVRPGRLINGHAEGMSMQPSTDAAPRVAHPGVADGKPLFYTPLLHRHRVPSVIERFLQLDADEATEQFLRDYCTQRESIVRDGLAHALRWMGWSRTDTNGILGRGQMFVCSHAHVRRLLRASGWGDAEFRAAAAGGALLDVGAGDGNVTATALAPLVGEGGRVVCTEASGPMCKRLRERGYECLETLDIGTCASLDAMRGGAGGGGVSSSGGKFDFVCLMNVLDRASHPKKLLADMKDLLKPGTGRVLMAVVLPFCPFVESGSKQLLQSERLNMDGGWCREGAHYEWSVDAMVTQVLEPAGFTVHAWAQLPYLCSGDRTTPYYVLYDAVFVMSVST